MANASALLNFDYFNSNMSGASALDAEELYFHRILLKYQPPELPPRTRLISVWWSTVVGAFFIFSTIFGIVGNLTVIVAIAGDRVMRRSAMNMLLLNLAIADMLNLMTTVVEWSSAVLYGYPAWDFPTFLCPATRYLECTFLFASILTQLVVCIERYIAIVYPMHVRRLCTRQNILFLACITWIVALIFSLPYALVHTKPPSAIICTNPYGHTLAWILYKWFEFLAAYFLPVSIMIFLYAKVACVLWSKKAHIQAGAQRPSALHADDRTRFEALDMRRGIIKMLVACVLVYFVSYSPIQGIFIMTARLESAVDTFMSHLIAVARMHCSLLFAMFGPSSRPPYSVVLILNAFAVMCSAANPLLYTLFSKKFRMRVVHLLSCGRHGSLYSRADITYSFARRSKKRKNLILAPDHHSLLQPSSSPEPTRRFSTPHNNITETTQ